MTADYLILCPYCLSQVKESSRFCPVCLQNISRDAKHEMTPEEYADSPQKPCRFCSQVINRLATRCPACRKWQE